jgi:hypothetical protein
VRGTVFLTKVLQVLIRRQTMKKKTEVQRVPDVKPLNRVEAAKQELEWAMSEVENITAEEATINAELEALEAARDPLVRRMGRGEDLTAEVDRLEGLMREHRLRAEGLALLKKEAVNVIESARSALDKA